MSNVGKKIWAIADGYIPTITTGVEPHFTSHDKIAILNTADSEANIIITVYFEDKDPQGPYKLIVAAKRTRKIRFNDLIDPLPIPLDLAFAVTIKADKQVVVQFSRMNTGKKEVAGFSALAFPAE